MATLRQLREVRGRVIPLTPGELAIELRLGYQDPDLMRVVANEAAHRLEQLAVIMEAVEKAKKL